MYMYMYLHPLTHTHTHACTHNTHTHTHTHTHTYTHTHLISGGSKVFEVIVKDVSCVYQAGSDLTFLRVPQGSAVITTETQNGVCM